MKKILIASLNDHTPWGGSEELWSRVAINLLESCQVAVLVKKWKNDPEQITKLINKKATIFYKPIVRETTFKELFINKIKYKFGLKKAKLIHDLDFVQNIQEYDLVVLSAGDHTDAKIVTYGNYLKELKIKYVIIVQLATDLRHLDDSMLLILKDVYENAKGVYYLSEDNIRIIEMQFGLVLSNGIKIDNPFDLQQSYVLPLENENYNIALVAAFTTFHKGQELLLNALSDPKWKKRNIIFNFYGNGINEMQIKRLVKLYQLENIVNLKGYESDKNQIWENNIACILPSRMEGQSLAMLEAMSFGRMIISTKVGDAQRLIKHNETGFLIEAPTVEFIDIALEQAWKNRTNWIEMGKLSKKRLHFIIKKDPVIEFAEKLKSII